MIVKYNFPSNGQYAIDVLQDYDSDGYEIYDTDHLRSDKRQYYMTIDGSSEKISDIYRSLSFSSGRHDVYYYKTGHYNLYYGMLSDMKYIESITLFPPLFKYTNLGDLSQFSYKTYYNGTKEEFAAEWAAMDRDHNGLTSNEIIYSKPDIYCTNGVVHITWDAVNRNHPLTFD